MAARCPQVCPRMSLRYVDTRHLAMISAIYTAGVSVVLLVLVPLHISNNVTARHELHDVYLGIQLSEGAIVAVHVIMLTLTMLLIHGIRKYYGHYVFLWIFGNICLTALESVLTVYNTVLKDHVYKGAGRYVKTELGVFLAKTLVNVVCIVSVVGFHHDLRAGTIKYWGHNDEEEAVML